MSIYKMIMDTETANSLEQPLPYDLGYIIFDDSTGRIVCKRSFVIAEIFLDKELMSSAYYADKCRNYWEDILSGKRLLKSFWNVRKAFQEDMREWNVKEVGAYNMSFDNRALNTEIRYISSSFFRFLLPYGTKTFCIWNMACSTICQTPEYIQFIIDNDFLTEKGNIPTSAEMVYRFLQNDPEFIESHTGLEDVRIEKEIYTAVKLSGMEYEDTPKSNCWMKVRKYYKTLMGD